MRRLYHSLQYHLEYNWFAYLTNKGPALHKVKTGAL
jgi:hypothetical protein